AQDTARSAPSPIRRAVTLAVRGPMPAARPPVPPFTAASAAQKVQAAEDAWNTCDAERVAAAYTHDSVWRNRDWFIVGRDEIVAFLTQKCERELDYVLRKVLLRFGENRFAVRYQFEFHESDRLLWLKFGQ